MKHKIKRALLSVANKQGLADLAQFLCQHQVEIISTGGTAKVLREKNLPYTPIEKVSGNPEAFQGRLKTLSFGVGAGLLYQRGDEGDEREAKQLGVEGIDLLVCNFYPFADCLREGGNWEELIEKIDIGGPTMVRAAAKNCQWVCTLTDPAQYPRFQELYRRGEGTTTFEDRRSWATSAFQTTALYEGLIASTLESLEANRPATTFTFSPRQGNPLRYGENPHQKAWVIPQHGREQGLAALTPLQGKALSYNNFLDGDAAWRCLQDLDALAVHTSFPAAAVIVKHGNPCGASLGQDNLEALKNAWAGDSRSAFGSVIALNSEVMEEEAQWILEHFVEVIIAPHFTSEAREILQRKKNLRLLELSLKQKENQNLMVRTISGGWLLQEEDRQMATHIQSVTVKTIPPEKTPLLQFGQIIAKHLKSNAIALVSFDKREGYSLVGAGMGQPNRLASLQQACLKAKENGVDNWEDVLLASDAFFPFKDSIEEAAHHGIRTIIQPGGSVRDQETITCCNGLGIAMAFTSQRHFRH